MKRLTVLLLMLPLLLTPILQAQQAQHNHTSAVPIIDGAVHPEQISDLTAYRLYLYTVGTLPTEKPIEKIAHQAHLQKTGLGIEDLSVLQSVADQYKKDFKALVDEFNSGLDPNATSADQVQVKALELRVDMLTATAMSKLSRNLTFNGFGQLNKHVQAEKVHMQTQGGQQ